MIVAGEASGDALAAELVSALRLTEPESELHLFGAGGARMAAAGVEILADLTQHALIGLAEAVIHYKTFRRLFQRLLDAASDRRPDAIVCVDFAGFNLRFAHAVRERARTHAGWTPTIVQYVSPQVWASRPGRAARMARDVDLVLAIFPFEPDWYAAHAPGLRVQFVGHPIVDRYGPAGAAAAERGRPSGRAPAIVLLPGSRRAEVLRHAPVMAGAARLLRDAAPGAEFRMVLPREELQRLAAPLLDGALPVRTQVGGLAEALAGADLAIASTGTVTVECAYFGVPTVALYRTSWLTYALGKRLITVPHLAMPNLLAREALYPELIQKEAQPERVAAAARALLEDERRRAYVRTRLSEVVASLGGPGASVRAARAISDALTARKS
jgi:lipid-A-disaccharide synthase